jgi:hypothetical protein
VYGDAQCLLQKNTFTSGVLVTDDAEHSDSSELKRRSDEEALAGALVQRWSSISSQSSFLQSMQTSADASLRQWPVTTSLFAVVGLGLAFVLAGAVLPVMPRALLSVVVIVVYISLSVTIDLLIMYQKDSAGIGAKTYKFDPTCSIILTELIKLVVSLTMYATQQMVKGSSLLPSTLSLSDVGLFLLPALFFTANNIMVFIAIGGNDASAFGVFRDTMILWTALIWVCIFKASLGTIRLCGIAVIFLGLVVNRLGSISRASFSWAFLLVMLMTVTNATGSVLNEYALKANKMLDINLQNAILYSMCIGFSTAILAVRSPVHLTSASAFFEGFTSWTVLMIALQASAGLLVSRLLKYADAVYKTIGTCLRGPSLVVAAPAILGSQQDFISVASAFIVAAGCLTYLTQGPLGTAKASDAKGAESDIKQSENKK